MRIFLDANLLFSASKTDGAIRRFIDLLLKSGHTLVADPYVQKDAERNIQLKYPASWQDLADILHKISMLPSATTPELLDASVLLDEKDRPVPAAAIKADCGLLITGDATHFGILFGKTVQGVLILNPRQAAEMLDGLVASRIQKNSKQA
ncbi:MAG: PIN domain-containing protein [Spirochaetota bacterium]